MTAATFMLKNALRNKRRAILSVFSVAVSLFLLVTLLVALREITIPPEDMGAALRVVVRSKVSIANYLPARQRSTIERIPGVEAVSPFTWYGGRYRDEDSMTFAQFAMDPTKLPAIFGEAKLTDEQYKAFLKDQTACILGKITADRYGIQVGDRIPFTSTIYPCSLEFHVAGIYSGTIDDRNLLFHDKYLDESCEMKGWVGTWWVKVRTPEDMPAVLAAINAAFANTSSEVRAETERAFQLSFVSMLGNVKLLVHTICSVVVFTLVLVTASTMSMAIRERFRELAVLKAIGFRRHQLFAFILAESFGLAAAGTVLGSGSAWLLYSTINIAKVTNGILLTFEVTPQILGVSAVVASGLGIIASFAPAVAVSRMSVVQGLKTLD